MSLTSDALLEAMQTFPLHRQFGFTITSHGDGLCEAACTIDSAHLNFGGVVHGGVMYLLLDVTAYCAAVTILPADTNATTHDIHVSMMRPTPIFYQAFRVHHRVFLEKEPSEPSSRELRPQARGDLVR